MAEPKKEVSLKGLPIDDVLKILNKKYGPGSFVRASQAKGTVIRYTPTGIYEVDYALGGGLPENRVIEFHGRPSSYKSTLLLKSMAQFQRVRPKGLCGYLDLERTFDPKYAKNLGVDLDRLILIDANTGELAVDQFRDFMEIELPLFVGIDSLAAMRPTAELDASAGDQQMALHPRLVGRAMGYINARLKRSLYTVSAAPVTVVVLNQLRATMDKYNPEVTPGGNAKNYTYSVIIRLSATNANEIAVKRTRNGIMRKIRIAQMVSFTVKKNKTSGPQNESGEFTFYERPSGDFKMYDIDNFDSLFRRALFHGVIQHEPTTFGYKYKKIVQKQRKLFIERLKALDEDEIEEMHFEVLEAVNRDLAEATDEDPEDSDEAGTEE